MRSTHFEQYIKYTLEQLNMSYGHDCDSNMSKLKRVFKMIDESIATQEYSVEKFLFIMMKKFIDDGIQIYKVAEEFGRDLNEVDLNVPVKYLPISSDCISIEFPDWAKWKNSNGSWLKSCYILQAQNAYFINRDAVSRALSITFPEYDDSDVYTGYEHTINLKLDKHEFIDQIIDAAPTVDGHVVNSEAARFAVKSYLYIHSGTPDLREIKKAIPPDTTKAKKLRKFAKDNQGQMFDHKIVGYDHKKSRLYNVDSVDVRGHYRWQPFGQNKSQVKLIWINAHVRNYQKQTL